MRGDFAVLKSNENFTGSFSTSGSGIVTMSYGDLDSEQSNTPSHTYSDFPPYLLNIKPIANERTIETISISGNTLTACDISRFRNVTNVNVADNLLPRNEISNMLIALDKNGLENGTLTTTGNISGSVTGKAAASYQALENKGWTMEPRANFGIWQPSDASPVGWYDASDADTITESSGQVTQWDDKSSNGRDMILTGGTPEWGLGAQINGMNVMHYQGTLDQMAVTVADIDLTEFCILGVGESKSVGDYVAMGYISNTANTDTLDVRFACNPTDGRLSQAFKIDNVTPSSFSSSTTDLADDNPFIQTTWYDGADFTGRINGGVLSETENALDGATFTINRIQCGRQSNTPRNYQGEYIIIPTADIATIEKAEGYLAHKWGLTAKLPSSHPYKTSAPLI